MRCGISSKSGKNVQHFLCADCKALGLVTRSIYSAELLRACTSADHSVPLAIQLEEFANGPVGPRQARRLREEGGLAFQVTLGVDAKSVFESLRASPLRIPTENSLYGHLAWLRELIKLQLIHTIRWVDTWDMSADALNKGTAPREKLLAAMVGKLKLDFHFKSYTPPKPKTLNDSDQHKEERKRGQEKSEDLTDKSHDEKHLVVLSMFDDEAIWEASSAE